MSCGQVPAVTIKGSELEGIVQEWQPVKSKLESEILKLERKRESITVEIEQKQNGRIRFHYPNTAQLETARQTKGMLPVN